MSLAPSPWRSRRPKTAPASGGWFGRAGALALPESLSLGVLSLSVLAALAAYAYRGWFSRYTADDYCTAGLERAAGFVGAQVYWYEAWSGRMTYYLVVGLVEYAGPGVVQVLPAIALSAWLLVGAWALLPLARRQAWPLPPASAAVTSAAVILVCLSGAPQLDQALYWQTGMLTYLLPLVLMTAYAGWLARRVQSARPVSVWELIVSGVFLLAVGGLSETSLSVQLALLGLGVCFSSVLWRSSRYRSVPLLLAVGLLATIVSGIIVVAAPGNYVHEASLTGSVHGLSQLPGALQASVDFAGLFARAVEFRARSAVLLLLVLSLVWGFSARLAANAPLSRRAWSWYAAALPGTLACGWVVLIAASAPGFYAQQWDPPERAQFVAVWVVALMLGSLGYLLGQLAGEAARRLGLRQHAGLVRAAWCAVLLLAAVAPLPAARATLQLVPADATYAADWDALDVTLRASASTAQPVVLDHTLPTHYGFDFLDADPTFYPNPCVARFYGLPSISVVQP